LSVPLLYKMPLRLKKVSRKPAMNSEERDFHAAAHAETRSDSIRKAIRKCKKLEIEFLALDFDQTILEIHTGGHWKGTAHELLPHVRPMFRELIPAALDEGIHVAVVTFSTQIDTIRYILDQITDHRGAEIPIRGGFGGNKTFNYEGNGSVAGKQAHMASAVEELEARNMGLRLKRASTLLIDDDKANIRHALENGVRAIWLDPDNSSQVLKDMRRLV